MSKEDIVLAIVAKILQEIKRKEFSKHIFLVLIFFFLSLTTRHKRCNADTLAQETILRKFIL